MIRLYIIGLSILVIAIVANGLANVLGLKTWYVLIGLLKELGLSGFKQLNLLDYFWLFIGYPLILGVGYWIGQKFHGMLF